MHRLSYVLCSLFLFANLAACSTASDSTTAARIAIGDQAEVLAEDATFYLVHSPWAEGIRVLTVGVTIDQDRYVGLGVELPEQLQEASSAQARAGVFIEQYGQVVEGVCDVTLWRSATKVKVHASSCTVGENVEVALELEHTGEIAAISVADSAVALPHFAPYAQRVVELSATSDAVGHADADVSASACSCQPSCDSQLNACLLQSFTCGGYYALCAALCYHQHSGCLHGCGC